MSITDERLKELRAFFKPDKKGWRDYGGSFKSSEIIALLDEVDTLRTRLREARDNLRCVPVGPDICKCGVCACRRRIDDALEDK